MMRLLQTDQTSNNDSIGEPLKSGLRYVSQAILPLILFNIFSLAVEKRMIEIVLGVGLVASDDA